LEERRREAAMVTEQETVMVTQKFASDEESIYDAFLNPESACKFLFATPTGRMVRAEIDARVGGRYTFVEQRDGNEVLHTGEYVELLRPLRMVFTFAVPEYSSEVSTVEINLAHLGEGCELKLINSGVPREYAEGTREGWARILLRARDVLAG
jgi:uncharacterized protein YndB with AHSA1/START domain